MWLSFPQIAMSGLRTSLGVRSVSWHLLLPPATNFSTAFPEPARLQYRASHTRAAVQTALDPVSRYRVGRGLFPSQTLRLEPVSHPRPLAPQQAASPPDSPRRAVRHAIQHAVGRTASPARLSGDPWFLSSGTVWAALIQTPSARWDPSPQWPVA